ncbi:hypothetical protein C8R45DRAFT_830934 [Mycena sanguinolenta]|nr:hypothetical protein C8R45DRAFT_830934 [Mycena sanguinolenta]
MSDIYQGESTLPPSSPQRLTLKQIWETLKNYFGDGYTIHSAPFRFNVHLCETQKVPVNNGNTFLGVNIDEDAMPLFGSLGETVKPPCTCGGMAAIYSGKNEVSVEETCAYSMRDALQWWVHWHDGSLARGDYWKHLYIGLTSVIDDILVPPEHILDGTFRFLGHTISNISTGMLSEGMSAEDVRYTEMCVWRGCFVQYIEKIDPKIRQLLLEKMHVMSQFYIAGANTHGVAAALLGARGVAFDGVRDEAVEMAAYGDGFSMHLMKEALGIMKGEPTDATEGGDRDRLQAELRWTYARTTNQLDTHELAKYLKKYASAGLHFVPLDDRYQERVEGGRRRMLTPQMRALIASYTVGPSGPVHVEKSQQKPV